MSTGTSFLRTTATKVPKIYFQWERRDWIKTIENETSWMEVEI